jgi:hypothetical protein
MLEQLAWPVMHELTPLPALSTPVFPLSTCWLQQVGQDMRRRQRSAHGIHTTYTCAAMRCVLHAHVGAQCRVQTWRSST